MKTIEERADRAIYEPTDRHPLKACEVVAFARGYELGATEQQAIDEEVRLKKCDDMTEAEYNRETAFVDWYLKNGKGTPTYSDAIEWARKDLLDKAWPLAYSMYQAGRDNLIPLTKDEFCKTMEE